QGLAIQDHLGVDESRDEGAVAHAAGPAGRVDPDDPQPAEQSLAHPPVAERELPPADQRYLRLSIEVVPAQPEPLGQLPGAGALPEDRFAASGSHGSDLLLGWVEAADYSPPMASMYLSAVGPVVTAALRRCRLTFDVRPASKCRRFECPCFNFPVAVILNRFLRLRFVLFFLAMCHSRLEFQVSSLEFQVDRPRLET